MRGARYAATGQGTVGTDKTILAITAATTVRPELYYFCLGSVAAPGDVATLIELKRATANGTRTAVTPIALDPANPAALTTAGENHSVEPTYTAASELLAIALNQRATLQWWAPEGGEIVVPATASAGIGLKSLSSTGTPTMDATMQWSE